MQDSLSKQKSKKRKISFSLKAPGADQVFLAGDFNNWDTTSHPMTKAGKGSWNKSLLLQEGSYEYKFIVDDQWEIDPKNHEGAKTMVNKKLVLEGLIPKEYGKWFRTLLFERENADYADYTTIDLFDAEEAFTNASNFIEKIKELVPLLVKQL